MGDSSRAGGRAPGPDDPLPSAGQRRLRLGVVCQRYQLVREYISIFDALERRFDVTKVFVDDGWPRRISDIPDASTFAACLWFVRFRVLIQQPEFRMYGYPG